MKYSILLASCFILFFSGCDWSSPPAPTTTVEKRTFNPNSYTTWNYFAKDGQEKENTTQVEQPKVFIHINLDIEGIMHSVRIDYRDSETIPAEVRDNFKKEAEAYLEGKNISDMMGHMDPIAGNPDATENLRIALGWIANVYTK